MRKYINSTAVVLVLLLSLSLTSCKKSFLEIVPKGALLATKFEDYNLLMNGSTFYVLNIWQPAIVMGDEVSAEQANFGNNGLEIATQLFQWKDDIYLPNANTYNGDNPQFLSKLLGNMYTLNKVIKEVETTNGGTLQQKLQVKSEAMVVRAFANFQLINYFGKPYLASTAAADPGFPIITEPDITQTDFPRGTVQGVYDFIIQDMKAAIPNLPITPTSRTRWSRAAAEGFLGKIYLFMGKNAEALEMFNASFSNIAKMAAKPRLYDYNVELNPGGSFLPADPINGPRTPFISITDHTESVVAIFSYAGDYDGNGPASDFLSIPNKTKELFDGQDMRLKLYTDQTQDQTALPDERIRRFTIPYSFFSRIGLELPDLYLLRAEAKARANDLAGAKADVETLRRSRLPEGKETVPVASMASAEALVKFIIDERIREFAVLGYRWWDMRRLSVDPMFSGQPAAKHTLYLTNGGTEEFTLRPQRLTLRFPKLYVNAHPEMPDNP